MGSKHESLPLLPRYLPWLCPKKNGAQFEKASVEVEDMYGTKKIERRASEARAISKILHITVHSFPEKLGEKSPDAPRNIRFAVIGLLFLMWLRFYPLGMQLRSIICAMLYSCTEYTFTFFERGKSYTSFAQFWGNLLYVPILLDLYGYLLGHLPLPYIVLFPFNIYLLEIVEGTLITWAYGRNVAWCYSDYSDCFWNDCCRWGHGPFWLGLGAKCFLLYPILQSLTDF